jgi:hypothetical protein
MPYTQVHVNGYLSRFLFRAEQGKLRVGQLPAASKAASRSRA